MDKQNCIMCHNHCPVDALNCDRGMEYFASIGITGKKKVRKTIDEMDTIEELLKSAGHKLHHGQGTISYETLDEQEKEQLKALLKKLLRSW